MKRVILLVLSFIIFDAAVFAATPEEVKQSIIKQAKQMNVDPAIVLSIAKTESGFNQNVKGAGGHVGVFQISPTTAKRMGINPYDMEDNVKGGIIYYKNMLEMFGKHELAVAAYNLGPDAIKRHNNQIPHHSQKFVNRIMTDYQSYKKMGM